MRNGTIVLHSKWMNPHTLSRRILQNVEWWHGNWHGSSCATKVKDFVIRNLQLWKHNSRVIFLLPFAITEGTSNPKPCTLSAERGRLKRKYFFQNTRPEFSSDLIFNSIQLPHMLTLEFKCIAICLAGSHLLSLSCYNGKKLETV